MERIGIVLELIPGSEERARELLAAGPPFDLEQAGFERHSVLAGNDRVVFVVGGEDVERHVREILDDPVRSADLARWAPVLAGPPRLVREAYSWERPTSPGSS